MTYFRVSFLTRMAALIGAVILGLHPVHAGNAAAIADVLKLKNTGLGDDIILSFIQKRNADYALQTDDIVSLKQQGVSSAVLDAMLNSGKGTAAFAPTAPPAPPPPWPPLLPLPDSPVRRPRWTRMRRISTRSLLLTGTGSWQRTTNGTGSPPWP